MKLDECTSKILGCSVSGYYKWKKQNRPIISLLELCFSKNELENFLLNREKPYKIEFADTYFKGLYRQLANYIMSNNSKALFSAILNNTDKNISNIDEIVLSEYNNKRIDNYDLLNYFNNKPSEQLLLYILENEKFNWLIFKESLLDYEWIIVYFDIFKLAIEKNVYDELFGEPNKEIDECIVPKPPLLFASYHNFENIEYKYLNILLKIKESISNNSFKELPKYSPFDNNFDLNTKGK